MSDESPACLRAICNGSGEQLDVQDGDYGMQYHRGVEVSATSAVELQGYVYDQGWTRITTLIPDSDLPRKPTRGIYVVSVIGNEVVDISDREFTWWPMHPEEEHPAALPNGEVQLSFSSWTRYEEDRYGAATFSGDHTDCDASFDVIIPRNEVDVVNTKEYSGVIISGEVTSIQPEDE